MKKMQQEFYKPIDFPPLTEEQMMELEYLKSMDESDVDCSDIPEKLETPILSYNVHSTEIERTDIHAKIDNDNLAWLKQAGKGYQSSLNNVLRWARMNNCPIETL